MKTFTYNPLSKFYFRYANLALSFILLTYCVILILGMGSGIYLLIFAVINLFIVYAVNKYYINTYKELPFIITAGDEALTASNFMFGKEIVEIKYSDIDIISGGVFGINPKGLIYIHDGEKNRTISIHPNIENVNVLLKLILNKVKAELREEAVKRLKLREEE